jgi:hypothetical protein
MTRPARCLPTLALLLIAGLPAFALLEPGAPGPDAAPAVAAAGFRMAKLKKLIEMGWDEPDPSFMRRHLAELEATPFDGVVYHILFQSPGEKPGDFTWKAWGKRTFTEAEVDSSLRDLQATRFKRLRWNFLRMNVAPGDIDWFDDYGSVVSNARLAASVARRGGSKGVFLDIEPYERQIWQYPAQRDTATRSYAEYEAQVRRRGVEVMRAFEQGYPGLTVFLSAGASCPYLQAQGGWHKETTRLGMLWAFVDGMVLAASDSARIVDGNEPTYSTLDPKDFDAFYRGQTHGVLTWVTDSLKYQRTVSRSFALWMDFESFKRPWHVVDADSNYRPPAQLTVVTRRALELADDYAWIYVEKPRFWNESGKPSLLPDAYVAALWKARQGLTPP